MSGRYTDESKPLPCGVWSHRPEESCEVCMLLDCDCLPTIHPPDVPHWQHADERWHAANRGILDGAQLIVEMFEVAERAGYAVSQTKFSAARSSVAALCESFAQHELRRLEEKRRALAALSGITAAPV